MNISTVIKKTLLMAILACSFLSLSGYANYEWNRHYTRCTNGHCSHTEYHRYCAHGHCWTHWHTHNWNR
jgi:hypothetical protein